MVIACFLSLGAAAQSKPSGSNTVVLNGLRAPGLLDCFLKVPPKAPSLENIRIFHKAGILKKQLFFPKLPSMEGCPNVGVGLNTVLP